MLKHIKLFEQYSISEGEILNEIYESWRETLPKDLLSLLEGKIDESDYFEEESELTQGEKRALAREMQIISKPQLGALYLFALGKEEGDPFKYIFRIPGILDFAEKDASDNPTITYASFADAIGLESMTTLSRTINKFKNLIAGVGEIPGEVVYPKVIQAYDAFKAMNTDTLAGEAGSTIQDSSTFTKNREAVKSISAKNAANKAAEKKNAEKYGYMVYDLLTSLRKNPFFSDLIKAQNMAVDRISTQSGIPTNKLLNYYRTYLIANSIPLSPNYAG
jgi:hypothetical protein